MFRNITIDKDKRFLYVKHIILSLPAIIYFFNVWKYAVNIPLQDDYLAILQFLNKYITAKGIDRFFLLFSLHNEHRIFSSRVVYVVYYSLFGDINFRNLIFIANFQLLILFYALLVFIKKCLPTHWFIASFITALCLFDLSGWENADFAMAAMQNYGIFLWLALSLLFYSLPGKKNMIAGLLFQFICIYSSGNGIVAGIIITLFNMLSGDRKRMILSSSVLLLLGPLYFIHYNPSPTGHPATDISKVVRYFFWLAGAHVIIDKEMPAVCFGIFVIVVFAIFFPVNKKLRINTPILPLACMSLFLILSMGVVALFRYNVAGVVPNSSRYLIYPHLLMALIFIFMLYRFQNKKAIFPMAACCIVLLLIQYRTNCNWGRDCMPALQHNLQYTDYYTDDKALSKQIADESCNRKIYCIQDFRQATPLPQK